MQAISYININSIFVVIGGYNHGVINNSYYFTLNSNDNLMFAYLTDARVNKVTRRESLCELGGLEFILNPCT